MDGTGELLAKTAALGEYFALPACSGGRWRELRLLFDDAIMADFVGRTQRAIAASVGCPPANIPRRVAASSFQVGIAARLLSPVIGAATCFSAVPLLDIESVRWQSTDKHFPSFAYADAKSAPAPAPALAAELISASVLRTVFVPLNDKLSALMSLSPQVCWGNAISAVNGAVTVLSLPEPRYEPTGRALVRALLTTESLTGTGDFVHGEFVRRSCCLFYQAPGSGLCGDCVIRPTA